MDDNGIDKLAGLLMDARRSGRAISELTPDIKPGSFEDGIRVQDEVERRLKLPIGGWKVGIPPGASTYRGPIFVPDIFESPGTFAIRDTGTGHIDTVAEGEFAFVMGRDLPRRGRPYSEAEIIDAIASACVTIEVLQWRVPETKITAVERVADNLGNAGMVVGKPSTGWRKLDRKAIRSSMQINGKSVAEKVGGKEGPSDPVALLVWLANHLTARGGLKTGHVVTTGAWVGPHAVRKGDVMTILLSGVGEAQATFT